MVQQRGMSEDEAWERRPMSLWKGKGKGKGNGKGKGKGK